MLLKISATSVTENWFHKSYWKIAPQVLLEIDPQVLLKIVSKSVTQKLVS